MRMEFTAIRCDLKTSNSRNLTAVVLLRRESGALLVGERTNRVIIRRVRKIICDDSSVDNIGDFLTMQPGLEQVLVNVDIRFRPVWMHRNLNSLSIRIEKSIRQKSRGSEGFLSRSKSRTQAE